MTPRYPILTVAGAGLLGASIGLAAKVKGIAGEVRGVGRRQETLDKALDRGAIDHGTLDLAEGCEGADLVVLCTPAAQVAQQLDIVRDRIKPTTLVTDAASTKAAICAHAAKTWPAPSRFVGAHPMAGSEKFGPDCAKADLFNGAYCIVCPDDPNSDAAKDAVRFWEAIGCTVITMDALQHDEAVARTSHVPHIVASALVNLLDNNEALRPMIGLGFKDTTRIASGRAELWRDICLTNAEPIARALEIFESQCADVRKAIQSGDAEGLLQFFEYARATRDGLFGP